jgi:hypothetical protein
MIMTMMVMMLTVVVVTKFAVASVKIFGSARMYARARHDNRGTKLHFVLSCTTGRVLNI